MSISTKIVFSALALIAVAVGAGAAVWQIKDGEIAQIRANDAKEKEAEAERWAQVQFGQDQVTLRAEVAAAQDRVRVVTKTQLLVQKVPVYVSQKADTTFPLPCGFVRVHDAAALGEDPAELPNPAGKPDDAACEVKASAAAAIIAENYGAARSNADELTGLQAWVRAEQTATNGPVPNRP